MARWVLSPVVGNGISEVIVGSEATTGPYRPKAADYATGWAGVIPGNDDGTPAMPWCIIRATAGDFAAANADPDLTVFPDLAMSDVLTLAQRNWLINKCVALGQPTGWVVTGLTFGEALRKVGHWLEANFEVSWVGE